MKTKPLHIFEILQQVRESPGDPSLQAQLDIHLVGCSACREIQTLIHQMQDYGDVTSLESIVQRLSNSQLVSNIKKRIQVKQFLPGLLQPLPDLAWITLVIVFVLLLSWGINTLRMSQITAPASSMNVSQPSPTPTQISSISLACRSIVYTVKEQDTLLAISAYFNVPMDIIWKENNLGYDSVLKPGMSLLIPFCGWTPAIVLPDVDKVTPIENCPQIIYTIQQGDTIDDISAFFGVPGISIVSENQLGDPPVLTPEAELVIRLCKTF